MDALFNSKFGRELKDYVAITLGITRLGSLYASLPNLYRWSNRYFSPYLLYHGYRNPSFLFCHQCHFYGICLENFRSEILYKDTLRHFLRLLFSYGSSKYY